MIPSITLKQNSGGRTVKINKKPDEVCQICNDGDFSDDNCIVFCSRCNISVHQLCYGIEELPEEDWICELCIQFGEKGKNMRCPCCTRRGGAMKPSEIIASMKPSSTNLQENLFFFNNPIF